MLRGSQGLGEPEFNTTRVALRSGAPPMSTTDEIFGDSDAPTIDKAIASSVVAQYVGSQLQTLTGHFQSLEPNQYAALYKRWGGSKFPFKEVPGYTDRGDNQRPIKLMAPGTYNGEYLKGATFEDAVHETIHLNSNLLFRDKFGPTYNEAITEYFTLKVLNTNSGKGHQDKLFLANSLISAAEAFTMPLKRTTAGPIHMSYSTYQRVRVGHDHAERYVALAYFRGGAYDLLFNIKQAFSRFGSSADAKFRAWEGISKSSNNAREWAVADQLLQDAVGNPTRAPPSGSSGSGSNP
jgi:hypothetical protein